MQVSKKSQYGLRAMVYLAKNSKKDKVCSIKKISESEGIPFDFLEKIFSELEKGDLIKAKKGSQGGYYLNKKLKQITVGKIVRILEKTTKPVKCAGCARAGECMTKSTWQEVGQSLDETLDSISLEDIINK
ncbi:MAG: Rrf2 family transcriptional regulator [Candidatus Nealsonbacteria bacterium]